MKGSHVHYFDEDVVGNRDLQGDNRNDRITGRVIT